MGQGVWEPFSWLQSLAAPFLLFASYWLLQPRPSQSHEFGGLIYCRSSMETWSLTLPFCPSNHMSLVPRIAKWWVYQLSPLVFLTKCHTHTYIHIQASTYVFTHTLTTTHWIWVYICIWRKIKERKGFFFFLSTLLAKGTFFRISHP